jgi:hypothetical protein
MIDYSCPKIHICIIIQLQNSPQNSAFPAEFLYTLPLGGINHANFGCLQ